MTWKCGCHQVQMDSKTKYKQNKTCSEIKNKTTGGNETGIIMNTMECGVM